MLNPINPTLLTLPTLPPGTLPNVHRSNILHLIKCCVDDYCSFIQSTEPDTL